MDWRPSRNLPINNLPKINGDFREVFPIQKQLFEVLYEQKPFQSHFIVQSPSRGLLYKNYFLGVFYRLKSFPRYLPKVLYALKTLHRYCIISFIEHLSCEYLQYSKDILDVFCTQKMFPWAISTHKTKPLSSVPKKCSQSSFIEKISLKEHQWIENITDVFNRQNTRTAKPPLQKKLFQNSSTKKVSKRS